MTQYYGVWIGRVPGVYDNWNDCKAQVDKFTNPKFRKLKSPTYAEAIVEFESEKPSNFSQKKPEQTKEKTPQLEFLTVDGAANGKNCEYQAVWYPSKKLALKSKQFDLGTNNIAEFLGLVSAIKFLYENNLPINIYTDSVTAMAWLRNKKANTTANGTGKITDELQSMINDAELFLNQNESILKNAKILKWETKDWGEIPADYGRK